MGFRFSFQPKSTAATALVMGTVLKAIAYMSIGTLPSEAIDGLSALGSLLLYPGLAIWISFAFVSLMRNVSKMK
ncbi:hypothetical protein [uncultured Methanolobus sp.]|uniref:hypothetical protein n=1 Tax=uncultured Methanolobus sp. TaxID=218300 RepID=UPI003747AD44